VFVTTICSDVARLRFVVTLTRFVAAIEQFAVENSHHLQQAGSVPVQEWLQVLTQEVVQVHPDVA